jgi:hypothetical protein
MRELATESMTAQLTIRACLCGIAKKLKKRCILHEIKSGKKISKKTGIKN